LNPEVETECPQSIEKYKDDYTKEENKL